MDFFSDSLARLKHYLRVSKDQEVAEALGMSKTAFSERKKRSSFPEKELRALAQQRPELGIDVDYVLTGVEAGMRFVIDNVRQSQATGSSYLREKQIIERYRADATFRQAVDAVYALVANEEPSTGQPGEQS
jgi:transcriptional regulator with XRE-family HTH domain